MADFRLDPSVLRQSVLSALDLLEKHLANLDHLPVKPQMVPGELAAKMAEHAPQEGTDLPTLMNVVRDNFLPAITHWQHRKFFAYYPAATSIPAIVSELLIATLGSVGLQWSANPAATELECVVMDWILDLLGTPKNSPFRHTSRFGGGIIQNTAGEALSVIMTAARVNHHARDLGGTNSLKPETLEELYWQDSSALVVYMSDQTHFSGPKAVRVAGMRTHKIAARILPSGNFGITAEDVSRAMAEDRQKGLRPCAVQLNYGSTNTCGYDDLESFRGFADRHQVWVHVDAAYAGPSLILPEFKDRSAALQEIATSFNFNGSKWFLCGFDSAFLYVRDRQMLKQVFAADGAYLARVDAEQVYNPELKDWSIPLGRRFRALRIWMVLSYFGRSGLEEFLRTSIRQGDLARQFIDQAGIFEQVVKTDLGLVCFRLKTDDEIKNERWIKRIEELSAGGKNYLIYPSVVEGRSILRLALGGVHTETDDVEEMLNICVQAAADVQGKK